jgi:hypothetical protein
MAKQGLGKGSHQKPAWHAQQRATHESSPRQEDTMCQQGRPVAISSMDEDYVLFT